MQTSTRLRAVIIGCGGMGRAHARALLPFDRFELVAASDPSPDARAEMQKVAPALPLYDDTDTMFQRERPETAIITTSSMFHHKLVLAALRAGAHVLCEKPFAVTLAEADEMLAVARETGRMLLIGHQFRINPRVLAGLRLVREGRLGDILALRCAGKGRHGGWELVETGTHLFDIAMLFAGAPRWVSAAMWTKGHRATEADIVDSRTLFHLATGPVVGERVHTTVGFDNGVLLHAEFLDIRSNNFVELLGTKGALHLPIGAAAAQPFFCPKPYVNPNDPDAKWQPVPFEWGKWGQEHNLYTYDLWAQWLADPDAKPMAIHGRHPMDAENGRLAMEIIHGAFESQFQDGRPVTIPLLNREHPLQRRMTR
ncbi:MAG: Gfo/Idh/MocA family oxidoreductase [Verrucomicrobiae bacterium]|nr:Gfo/Idh/MocA family oxidoreductase [Verrucomicrobiae bacterium]